MKNTVSHALMIIILFALYATAVLVNQLAFKGISVDLTENKVFSLSDGTKQILEQVDEPINLYYFFSEESTSGMTSLRSYATQVEAILDKYEASANGNITLHKIDPKPFSESEDRAATFGLTAASSSAAGDSVYFGLAGTNSLDDVLIIPFFDPAKESFLEYDLSKLIYQLDQPELPKLSIITSLALGGGQNPVTGRVEPPNVIYNQLSQLFDVALVGNEQEQLPPDTQVLLIWHPQQLNEELQYSIDQYIMSGGKAIISIDPHFESDPMAAMGGFGANGSELPLLSSYGIDVDLQNVVLDAELGLEVQSEQAGVIRHLGFLGVDAPRIDAQDITTADLESVNGASFASIELLPQADLRILPLLQSSQNTALIPVDVYANEQDPAVFQRMFDAGNVQYTLAARITGTVQSAFVDTPQSESEGFVGQTSDLQLVVIADADIMADRFWVQQSRFFGETVYNPFANNADFVTNLVENFGGSEGLIGIRSRGTFNRPFTKVQALAVVAEQQFREQQRRLQDQLAETEQQLAQLQSQQSQSLNLSADQKATIDEFVAKRIEIRKALRDVQYQLDKDIDALGNALALLNIVVAPMVLVLLLYLLRILFKRKANIAVN